MHIGLAILALSAVYAAPKEVVCSDRSIKLWVSHDLTDSFTSYVTDAPKFSKDLINTLESQFPQLRWGYSGFKDRGVADQPEGSSDALCYSEATDFSEPSSSGKIERVVALLSTIGGGGDVPEDAYSSIPYISVQKFGKYTDQNELRIMLILTDAKGKYYPAYGVSGSLPDPTTEVKCRINTYPYLSQCLQPMKDAGIILVVILPTDAAATRRTWENDLKSEKVVDYTIKTVDSMTDSSLVANVIIDIVKELSCQEVTTTSTSSTRPTTTTTSTTTTTTTRTTTTTTTTPTTTTTTTPTTTTTTTPTTKTTTSSHVPTGIPTISPTNTPATTTPKSNKGANIRAIVGGSAGGLAVLGLIGGVARYYSQSIPMLDVGEEIDVTADDEEDVRESAVRVDERGFADF